MFVLANRLPFVGRVATKAACAYSLRSTSAVPQFTQLKYKSTTSFANEGELNKWTNDFLKAVEDVPTATDPYQSSNVLRKLVKTGLLRFTDMRDAPEKFFMAHRMLATIGLGGFGIRFTVQFNLFTGSIVGLAGPEQLPMLDQIQKKGQLGCFLLTENQAGVLSGLIVGTTADWDSKTQEFILHTPNDKAAKNWISQGYTAEMGVVIANLRIDGKSYGPHPFYMNMRDGEGGKLLPGIRIVDMGIKTIANDLDNARVWFDKVRLPKDALLNRFCDIKDNEYVQVGTERMRIEVIGQRLLTGRLAIAEAALYSAKVLHMKTEKYANTKICNGLAGETTLAQMPQLKACFEESYRQLDRMIAFTAAVEDRLNVHLRHGTIPDADLVEKLAVCKIKCIDVATQRVHALRQEVGSYALMWDTGFELVDMLLTCKFAEGDSRILQQKLARDRLKRVQKGGVGGMVGDVFSTNSAEAIAAISLARKLAPAGRDLQKMAAALDVNWRELYGLSDMICERHINSTQGSKFIEPCVERLRASSNEYDHDWKSKLGSSTIPSASSARA